MLPPPPAEYESANELFKNVQTFANSQDYRKDHHSKLKNMTLRCDRSGIFKNSPGLTEETCQGYKNIRFILCTCKNKKIMLDLFI